jgi:TRAP-type mannitol/chloroaromatic compound transport system permease small subunit
VVSVKPTSPTPVDGGPDREKSRVLRIADSLEAVIDRIGRWVAWISLAMVVLVANNVILRYLFHIGPVSLQELEWHLMSPIALIGMSYCMRHKEHVRVDIFYDKYSPALRNVIDLAAAICTIIVSVIIIELSLGFVEQAYASGEISPDPGGLHYRWLLKSFIPFGFGLLTLQAAAQALRCGFIAAKGGGDGK